MKQLGMKKAHLLKFRRALRDAKAEGVWVDLETGQDLSVFEAEDGFRGTYREVLAHEAKLVRLRPKPVAQAPADDGLQEALAAELPPDQRDDFVIYEVEGDGYRGSLDECLAHEDMLAKLANPALRASRKDEAPINSFEDAEDSKEAEEPEVEGWSPAAKSSATALREEFARRARRDAVERGEGSGTSLGKAAFISFLKYLLATDASSEFSLANKPSDADLECCFSLADDDKSGDVNVEEVELYPSYSVEGLWVDTPLLLAEGFRGCECLRGVCICHALVFLAAHEYTHAATSQACSSLVCVAVFRAHSRSPNLNFSL
jgi:hypothetical protein